MRINSILYFVSAIVFLSSCNPSKKAQRQVNENYTARNMNKTLSPTETYILKYKDIAVVEMNRTGIPASITLAQAILESGKSSPTTATTLTGAK